ncbi:hypothetical protein [Pedobacter sp. NJ-S-72]
MKSTSTPRILKNYLCLLVSILAITLFNTRSYAQTKNYATVTPSTGTVAYTTVLGIPRVDLNDPNAGSITNPGNASVAPPVSPAALKANYFNLLGLANADGEAWIQLKYNAPLAAGKNNLYTF